GCQTSTPRFLWETDLERNETAPGRQARAVAGRPGVRTPCSVTRGAVAPRRRSLPVLALRPSAHVLLVLIELLLPLLVLPLVLFPVLVLVPILVPIFVLVLPVLLVPLLAIVLVLPEREKDQVFLLPAGARAPRQHLHWSPSLRGGWDGPLGLPPRGHRDRMPGYRNAAPKVHADAALSRVFPASSPAFPGGAGRALLSRRGERPSCARAPSADACAAGWPRA